jgi:hypothetical protein
MDVTMLLCDAAEAASGKLYVLGGGWSHLSAPNIPVNMALAVMVQVPWNRTNEKHSLRAALVTEDGEPIEIDGNPIMSEAGFEVGRPPGLNPGTTFNTPVVFNIGGLVLEPGGYVWELYVNGQRSAQAAFRVTDPQQMFGG